MNKFKPGDAVLYKRPDLNGRILIGKILAMYPDGHYTIETSNGFLLDAQEENLMMYKLPHKVSNVLKNAINSAYGCGTLIKKVIFSDMATIVIWEDGTKTIVRKQDDDVYDPEKAIAMCFMKKMCQRNKWSMNEIFETWINKDSPKN